MVPVRNSMLETWPSPTARTLIRNRVVPAGSDVWSGCTTIEGLNSAADSTAYSWLKYAPMSRRRGLGDRFRIDKPVGDEPEPLVEGPGEVPVPTSELRNGLPQRPIDLLVGEGQHAVEHRRGAGEAVR